MAHVVGGGAIYQLKGGGQMPRKYTYKKQEHKPKLCRNQNCKQKFTPARFWQDFCSTRCRVNHHQGPGVVKDEEKKHHGA